jgi:hypothetical protein
MKFFILSYTLKTPGKDVTLLSRGLSSFPKSLKCLENTWLIGTEDTPKEIYNKLKLFFDQGDRFIIFQAEKNYWGLLPTSSWEWVEANM